MERRLYNSHGRILSMMALLTASAMACNIAVAAPTPQQSASTNNAQSQQAPAQGQAQGGRGGGQGGGEGTVRVQNITGTIADLAAQRFTVSTFNGPVQVSLSQQTRYTKFDPVTLADLKPGDNIVVRGTADDYGNLIVDTVQIMADRPTAGAGGPSQRLGAANAEGAQAGGGNRQQGAGGAQGNTSANRPQGNNAAGGNRSQFQDGQGGGGGARVTRGGQRSGVTGQVMKVEGTVVTFSDQSGPQLFIVNGRTSVSRSAPATAADLKPGVLATVVGQAGTGGALTAVAVTLGDELATQ